MANMANFKQKKFMSKSGKEYVFQHPGVRAATKITDRVKNKHGIPSDERLAEEMLQHVVVEPKLRIDDFASYRELGEVVGAAFAFVTGQDEDDADGDQQA
ncbi:hypothetical protein [Paenibacillus popilliae]|uniref:Uncharacterized protein n=1 Tax=Paenibacillus popilliae ATCC 14706 TaxID=1212764 RepID=M9LF57_PAEPP|nr:hypothetical protein [Paenibacillus popilliae]GAC40860.1 hypothetical protein PPOP_0188 [Paenibacillus popilliae ATCC 14706]